MESDGSGRALVLRDTLAGIRLAGFFTKLLTALISAPSTGIEPVAYRLGGGRSIRLSYEGEGGALCGALLPVTVFLAVKVTGGPGLALLGWVVAAYRPRQSVGTLLFWRRR